MKIIGVDLDTRQQTIAMLDDQTGELLEKELQHEGDEVRRFYSGLSQPVLVGLEATGSMHWFLRLLEELNIDYRVGQQSRRLMTHPGVGPITALATEVFLGDPRRFASDESSFTTGEGIVLSGGLH
ncbi:MAG TPA: transposase [Candidatus Dormibacteraeota bacterium]|nr:transposase [Candidatus Dormibacteraeota bacterium]